MVVGDTSLLKTIRMKSNFIVFQTYKGFKVDRNALMSLIVGLHKSKQSICFSNDYAADRLGVCDRQIRNMIKEFVDEGYIKTFMEGKRRLIYLIKEPDMIGVSDNVCSVEDRNDVPPTQEYHSTNTGTTFHHSRNTIPDKEEPGSTYNIVDNIDDSIAAVWQPSAYPSDFLSLVERYNEEGVNMEKAFQVWNKLDAVQRKLAFDNVEKYCLYLESDKNRNGYYKKELAYYLQDGIYSWGAIKNFRVQPKKLSKEEQNKLALEQYNKLYQK